MRIRTRIWILIKVIKSAIIGERPGPSIAPFEHPQLLNFDSGFGFGFGIWQKLFGSDADPDTALYMFVCMFVLLLACLSFLVQLACMETDAPIINRLKVYLNI